MQLPRWLFKIYGIQYCSWWLLSMYPLPMREELTIKNKGTLGPFILSTVSATNREPEELMLGASVSHCCKAI